MAAIEMPTDDKQPGFLKKAFHHVSHAVLDFSMTAITLPAMGGAMAMAENGISVTNFAIGATDPAAVMFGLGAAGVAMAYGVTNSENFSLKETVAGMKDKLLDASITAGAVSFGLGTIALTVTGEPSAGLALGAMGAGLGFSIGHAANNYIRSNLYDEITSEEQNKGFRTAATNLRNHNVMGLMNNLRF